MSVFMGNKKIALITGVTGQDGSYLAHFLLDKGYEVHGIKRRSSLFNTSRIDYLFHDVHETGQPFYLHHGDMTDSSSLMHIIQKVKPDEIYNLAAQSHVAVSFEEPEYTANSDAIGALRILEAIRILELAKKTKFYQASTSELYGLVQESPQKRRHLFTRGVHTLSPSFMHTGSLLITGRPMVSTLVTGSYLIMRVQFVARHLLPEKLLVHLLELKLVSRSAFIWVI